MMHLGKHLRELITSHVAQGMIGFQDKREKSHDLPVMRVKRI